jgi:hypothetical protein
MGKDAVPQGLSGSFPRFAKFLKTKKVMDPSSKDIPLDVAFKMLNDQAHYEIKRNVCLAVLLYFGTFLNGSSANFLLRWRGILSQELWD